MKISLEAMTLTPVATPEYLLTLGRVADEYELGTLWFPEHVVLFDDYQPKCPYTPDGYTGIPGDSGILDPLNTISFLASVTTTVRLGTGVLLLPQRHPVYTGKEVATLDWLSGGRVDLGLGLGWQREEYDAVGVPWKERAPRCREYVGVLRTMWGDEVSHYDGSFVTLPESRCYPKPPQGRELPIHFGGESEAALRRVAEIGNGWHGINLTPDAVTTCLGRLDTMLAENGRARADVRIALNPALPGIPVDPSDVARYADAGVQELVFWLTALTPDEIEKNVDAIVRQYGTG